MSFIEEPAISKSLPYIVYGVAVLLSIYAGWLVYTALASKSERFQHRLRIKQRILQHRDQAVDHSKESLATDLLSQAGNPLSLNGLRYNVIRYLILLVLIINYVITPIVMGNGLSIWLLLAVIGFGLLSSPAFPYSLFVYVVKKFAEFRLAKRNSEIFILYDLLISEIEMMSSTRVNTLSVNTFNLIKGLLPYFQEIRSPIKRLLVNWTEQGPRPAINVFVEDLGTKEARSLGTILKTLDENTRETALEGLKSMNEIFVKSQIENYRRKRKMAIDFGSLPIKSAHFLIILNLILVVVFMVINIMSDTSL